MFTCITHHIKTGANPEIFYGKRIPLGDFVDIYLSKIMPI